MDERFERNRGHGKIQEAKKQKAMAGGTQPWLSYRGTGIAHANAGQSWLPPFDIAFELLHTKNLTGYKQAQKELSPQSAQDELSHHGSAECFMPAMRNKHSAPAPP